MRTPPRTYFDGAAVRPGAYARRILRVSLILALAVAGALVLPAYSHAAVVTLNASDAAGTTSFNTNLHWNNGAAPAAGNTYFTAAFNLRTPPSAGSFTFAGDSLQIDPGGQLVFKTLGTITVNNLILAGGALNHAGVGGTEIVTLNGNINLTGNSTIATAAGETLIINSAISGSGNLIANSGAGTVTFATANSRNGSTNINAGTVSITNASGLGTGAVAVNGTTSGTAILQLSGVTTSSSLNLTLNGADASNRAFLTTISASPSTWGGNITLLAANNELNRDGTANLTLGASSANTITSTNVALNIRSNFQTTINSTINLGAGLVTQNESSTLLINSTGNTWGNMTIAGAATTLRLGVDSALPATTEVNLSGTSAKFDLNGKNQTIAGLTGSSGRTVTSATAAALTVNNTSDFSYSGLMSGSLALTKSGTGKLTLSGTNSYTGSTTINNGILSIGAEANLGTTPGAVSAAHLSFGGGTLETSVAMAISANRGVTINAGGATFDVNSGTTLTVNSAIAGSGPLTKLDTGTVSLAGNNSAYTGTITVSNGTLVAANNNALGTTAGGTFVNGPGGTAGNKALHLNGVTIGAEPLTLLSNDAANRAEIRGLTGTTNTFGGAILLQGAAGGVNMIVADGTNMTLGGNITFDVGTAANLQFRGGGTGTIASTSTVNLGTNTFGKTDVGTWIINSTGNTWGSTLIAVGTVQLGASGAMPSATVVTVGQGDATNATLNLAGFNQTVAGLVLNTAGGTKSITTTTGTSTFTVDNTGTHTFNGLITNSGGATLNLVKAGTGTLQLGGANTYTGTTTVNNGTLRSGANNVFPDTNVTVNATGAGVTGLFDLNNFSDTIAALSLGGTTTTSTANVATGTGTLTLGGNVTYSAANNPLPSTISGKLALGAATRTFTVGDTTSGGPDDLIVTADISGAVGLTKDGDNTGILRLSGNNSFTGNVLISNGGIRITNSNALGTGPKTVTIANGTAGAVHLRLDGSGGDINLASNISFATSNVTGPGTIINEAGNNTINGNFDITSGGGDTVIVSSGGSLTLTGNLNLTASSRNLQLTGASNGNVSGTITNSANTLSLIKGGDGVWTLSGGSANTFSGVTTISDGTLELNKAPGVNALAGDGNNTTTDVLINGGTLRHLASDQIATVNTLTGDATINMTSGAWDLNGKAETVYAFTNSGGTFNTGAGGQYTGLGNTTTWSGGSNTVDAASTATDSHWVITDGVNTVNGAAGPPSGGSGGQLIVAAPGGVGLVFGGINNPTITVNSDATSAGGIVLNNNVTVDATLSDGTARILNGGNAANPGYVDLGGVPRTFDINDGSNNPDMLISARLRNGSLTKTGAGQLRLTGDNTYTGATTVNAGTLELAAPGTLQNGSIAVNGGNFLQSGGTNNVTGASGNLNLAAGASYQLQGGTLNFGDYAAGGTAWTPNDTSTINMATGSQFQFTGGTLSDVSQITPADASTFAQQGGSFIIGQSGVGPAALTTVSGGFSLLAGTIFFDAFGPDLTAEHCCDGVASNNDQLAVLGDAFLNGTLDIKYVGFDPEFGDSYTLLCAQDIELGDDFHISGGFYRIIPVTGDPNGPWALQAIVPEPTSVAVWTLIGLAGAAAAWRNRKRLAGRHGA